MCDLNKAPCEAQSPSPEDFWAKVKNCTEHLRKNYFIFQRTTDRAHPVQISSRSDSCIITNTMRKPPEMPKDWLSLKNRSLVPTTKPEPDFPNMRFCKVLDIVSLFCIWNLRRFYDRTQRYEKKRNIKSAPKMGVSLHLWPPKIFSKIGPRHPCTPLVP